MTSMPLPCLPTTTLGARLVTADGADLPLRSASLDVDGCAGLARVVLRQTFHNPYDEPLRVTYQVPLPADASVGGYAFVLGGTRITGAIDRRSAARERFEEALIEGRTAALLEQDRSSLFTQEVGNLPPGAEVVCELILDQPLAWRDTAWEWRFPTVVAPRYMGGHGRVPDLDRVSVEVSETPQSPRIELAVRIRDALTGAVSSPSHPLSARAEHGATVVGLLAEEGAALDRDLVVRWPVAEPDTAGRLDLARPAHGHARCGSAFGLLTLVPPLPASREQLARDLIVLIDTSGSMHGQPMDQATAVVHALIGSLDDADRLELIEFSRAPRRWKAGPVHATPAARAEARAWVTALRAGGGTEMRAGILEALRTLRPDAQRQVVLITDGLIGFEHEIVGEIRDRLPPGCRVHVLGVGSSVNRSLTRPAARAGHGLELILGLDEAPGEAAERLVARTALPMAVDLELSGSAFRAAAARALPDLYAGAPAIVPVELDPAGGELIVRGKTSAGPWQRTFQVSAPAVGEGSAAIPRLFGRERVEDLEADAATGVDVDFDVERLGLQFSISTRLTSWVAISDGKTVDPCKPGRSERIPQDLPYGMSVEGLGLRAPALGIAGPMAAGQPRMRSSQAFSVPPAPARRKGRARPAGMMDLLSRTFGFGGGADDEEAPEPARAIAAMPSDGLFVAAPIELRGTLRLRRDDHLVVEITVDRATDWRPNAPVEIVLDDGSTVAGTVRLDRTTAAGPIAAGQVVRLVIEVAIGRGEIREVRFACGPVPWVVRL